MAMQCWRLRGCRYEISAGTGSKEVECPVDFSEFVWTVPKQQKKLYINKF